MSIIPGLQQAAFEIPLKKDQKTQLESLDTGVVNALIAAVPNTWTWFDGRLAASPKLIQSGEAIADFCFVINGDSAIRILNEGRGMDPTAFSQPRLPGRIWFKRVGLRHSFDRAKQEAMRYVIQGYQGKLKFVLGGDLPMLYGDVAMCVLRLESGPIRQLHVPPYVHFKWITDDSVAPLVEICQSFELSPLPLDRLAED